MKNIFPIYSIGHFINQPANPTEFEIMRFEKMEEPNVDDIHKHTFYEILWTEKGKSKQTIDYQEYEIKPNSLFFISPNQVHQFEEWRPLTGGSILFTEDFFLLNHNNKDSLFELSFLDNLYSNPCINLSKQIFEEVRQTIDLISKEHGRRDKNQTILQSLLHVLMAQVQRYVDREAKQAIPKKQLIVFKKFKTLLELHFIENKMVSFYAERLNMTQHHLNLISKKVSGETASAVIRKRSMLEAKRLLTFTDHTMSEIAFSLTIRIALTLQKYLKRIQSKRLYYLKKEMSEKYRRR